MLTTKWRANEVHNPLKSGSISCTNSMLSRNIVHSLKGHFKYILYQKTSTSTKMIKNVKKKGKMWHIPNSCL